MTVWMRANEEEGEWGRVQDGYKDLSTGAWGKQVARWKEMESRKVNPVLKEDTGFILSTINKDKFLSLLCLKENFNQSRQIKL